MSLEIRRYNHSSDFKSVRAILTRLQDAGDSSCCIGFTDEHGDVLNEQELELLLTCSSALAVVVIDSASEIDDKDITTGIISFACITQRPSHTISHDFSVLKRDLRIDVRKS